MRLIFLCALAIFTAVLPSEALAGKFEVIVQTGSLTGTGTLSFSAIDNDGVANNTATITGFTTDGLLGLVTQRVGTAVGTLPPTMSISDDPATFPVLYEQQITFNSFFRFFIDVSNAFSAGGSNTPDVFDLVLIDSSDSSVPSTDPVNALFVLEATGDPSGPQLTVASPTASSSSVTWSVQAVPEPGSLALLGLGLGVLATRFRRRLR